MKTVHIGNGKETLAEVPKAPVYLTESAKRHWKVMGSVLAKNELLKEKNLPVLEVYSEAMAQWEFAIREIQRKNKLEPGTGYVQTYKTGASNVSVEITLRNDAESSLFKCFKAFGLDPRSEKELKNSVDPAQTNLFEQLMAVKNAM